MLYSETTPADEEQSNTPSGQTGEQESSGPGHRTHDGTDRTGTLVNRSQVAQDTAQTTQRKEQPHQ